MERFYQGKTGKIIQRRTEEMRRGAALIKITKSFNRNVEQKGFGSVTKMKVEVLKHLKANFPIDLNSSW